MKIAIIGGSIAGLEAAIRLSPKHDVTLYEEHEEIGYPLQCAEGWARVIEPYGCVSKVIETVRIRQIDLNTLNVKDEIRLDVGGMLVTIDRPKMEKKMAEIAESRGCTIVTGRKVKISELFRTGYELIVDASGHPSQWDREFGVRRKGGGGDSGQMQAENRRADSRLLARLRRLPVGVPQGERRSQRRPGLLEEESKG